MQRIPNVGPLPTLSSRRTSTSAFCKKRFKYGSIHPCPPCRFTSTSFGAKFHDVRVMPLDNVIQKFRLTLPATPMCTVRMMVTGFHWKAH